jgi:hypothetical protein
MRHLSMKVAYGRERRFSKCTKSELWSSLVLQMHKVLSGE